MADNGYVSQSLVKAMTAKASDDDVHFRIAQKAANEKRKTEKEKTNELQKKLKEKEITNLFFINNAFPLEEYNTILEIMCVSIKKNDSKSKSYSQEFIERQLELPARHKEIQILENLGIKKFYLEDFISSSQAITNSGLDISVIDIVIFMFRNGFFTQEEILANLSLVDPIPFYNPDVVIDEDESVPGSGFSAKLTNKLAAIPKEISEKGIDSVIKYVNERFERLKTAVRDDYFQRKSNLENKDKKLLALKPKEA